MLAWGWRVRKARHADHIGAISGILRLMVLPGSDHRHPRRRRNLNGEHVLVRNTGAVGITLNG
jgi:hypothetical protein